MDSPFMDTIVKGLVASGLRVARFEFPYMRARREGRGRKPPDREAILLQSWRDVIKELGGGEMLVIGGKSLGGRIASMIADAAGVRGLLCFGYPFHAPGKPVDPHRLKHLHSIRTPTLILQGERDPFGPYADLSGYNLSSKIKVEWLPDGDHSFKPRARSGHTEAANLHAAIEAAAGLVHHLANS